MKRPTVSIIPDTRREKKGTLYSVKLWVTHQRKQKYWYTGIDLTEAQFVEAMAEKPKKHCQNLSYSLKDKKRNAESIIDEMGEFSFARLA